MPMGFDFQPSGAPDINLRQRPLPQMSTLPLPQTVGFQGGNVRPVTQVPPMTDAQPRQINGPNPNAQAYAHANPNARFMRTDQNGNTFADNPAGQRPGPNQSAMDNANPRANFLRSLQSAFSGGNAGDMADPEFRRRQFLAAMARRMGQGGGQNGGFVPPQYQMGQLPLQQPSGQMPVMNTLPLQQPSPMQISLPSGGFYAGPELSMGTLPLQQQSPQYGGGMYDLLNQM